MKKPVLIIVLLIALVLPLSGQEISVSASLDFANNLWMSRPDVSFSVDEYTSISSTLGLSYLQRLFKERLKIGLGISYLLPRAADNQYDITYSDFAIDVIAQVYPVRFSGMDNLADNIYAKLKLGYNQPIFSGDFIDNNMKEAWGDFHLGAGAGFDFPFGLFVELQYDMYWYGASVGGYALETAGFQNFSLNLGYRFIFGTSQYK